MAKGLRYSWLFSLIAALAGPALLGSCTNDLKKIKEVTTSQTKGGADTTKGADIIFSDSAHVKARMTAPLVLDYTLVNQNKEQYRLMPKGVKIILFDKNHKEEFNLIADTAYYYDMKRLVKFYKNVVLTSVAGDVFRSQELIWDQNTKKIWSTKPVDLTKANGDVAHASSMTTTESLYPLNTTNSTGLFTIDSKIEQ